MKLKYSVFLGNVGNCFDRYCPEYSKPFSLEELFTRAATIEQLDAVDLVMDWGMMDECQRPLRAQTPQGERVSIAISDMIAAGAQIEFTIQYLNEKDERFIREWLDYGQLNGIGQWRNSGKGRFTWEAV